MAEAANPRQRWRLWRRRTSSSSHPLWGRRRKRVGARCRSPLFEIFVIGGTSTTDGTLLRPLYLMFRRLATERGGAELLAIDYLDALFLSCCCAGVKKAAL